MLTELKKIVPQSDYKAIQAAIRYLSETGPDMSDIAAFARAIDLTERQLTDLFRRWCGLSPKSFAQAVALNHAKRLLRTQGASVLATTYEVGLSAPSRLHDLFVTYHAMPPGMWARYGEGITMCWGVARCPFGNALILMTEYGLAGLAFFDDDLETALADMQSRWPAATYRRDDHAVAAMASRIFDPAQWNAERPIRVVLIGTDFEVRVWETLLSIPLGGATTYGTLADQIGKPTAARAVGAAVGRNPVSFVVPCHRVVGANGNLTGYHWGLTRKRAILGWEAGVCAA